MNRGLDLLQPYPFEKLAKLFDELPPPENVPISLTIGEPQHAPPAEAMQILADRAALLGRYPATNGLPSLRAAISRWLERRFKLNEVDENRHVLPLNGTREGLFAMAQTVVNGDQAGAVICPNPFYQIYEGAALLAGTQPVFINCDESTGFLPDFSVITADQWRRCQLLYVCTPGNPSGAVMPKSMLQALIAVAQEHDFLIASDECYSEIYPDELAPPPGLLQAAAEMGNTEFRHCLCFHSLSKRSNLPGLRSGFVAGDARWIERFRRYRTYHGCAMPLHHQAVSEWAWSDESHVEANRAHYRQKFAAVIPVISKVLSTPEPEAGFYLWPQTPIDDEAFARELMCRTAVSVLPGSYLTRNTPQGNPGAQRVRMALVAGLEDCTEAAQRIADCLRDGW